MDLILCRKNNLGSALLRLFMWSRWSHSAIHDTETGFVYEARTFRKFNRQPYEAWLADYQPSKLERRSLGIPEERLNGARLWLHDQLGKNYDYWALIGFPLRRNWQSESDWFCSEASETLRNLFGLRPIFRADAARITPRDQDIVI